ncbi:MAG: BamA/TamA family outer membrane protein [Kofleriaceae bacterium]
MLKSLEMFSDRVIRASLEVGVLIAMLAGPAAAQVPPVTAPDVASTVPDPGPGKQTTEFNIVPLVGGNSDVGFGGGQVSNLAGLAPGVQPYRWSLETSAFVSFKSRDGGVVMPYQDYFIFLHLRDVGTRGLRIDLRAAYTDEATLKFYGIGNASKEPAADVPVEDTEFSWTHPTLLAEARLPLPHKLFALVGSVFTYNSLDVAPTSMLGRYVTTGPAAGRAMIGSFDSHGVELLELGLEYDSRDREVDTRSGHFHTAMLRISPKVGDFMPYAYERLTLTARSYAAVSNRITLAFRVVGDALFGDAPFYELARYDQTQAIGGVNAIRGVPGGRYYGAVKLFGNIEARSDLFGFHLRGKAMKLGVAAFFDGGRTWTELLHSHPELDGTGIGLKYGIGGGLRLRQGATFVVRADVAYSPDASPVGAYFTAGQIF